MADHNKRIAKNTLFLYIRNAFSLIVTLYTSRVILIALGVEDYGVYNVVAGFVSMFAFLNTALTSSIQRYYNYENGKNGAQGFQKVYITSIFIQLILAAVALLLIETIGLWYLENKLVIPEARMSAARVIFQLSALSMALVIMQVPYSSAIMAKEKMDYFAIVGIIDVLLKLVIALAVTIIPYDKLVSYGWLLVMVSVFNFFFYFVYSVINFAEIKIKFVFYRELFYSMIKFSGWSALNGFSQIIRHQGINILLNIFFGPVVNAARGISYQVKGALVSFVGNVTTASRPQLVEAYAKGNIDRSIKLMNTTSKICFLLLFVAALPISIEVDFILDIWLKGVVPQHTPFFTILVLASTLIDILQTPVGMMVYATGKIAKYNIASSILSIAILPIAYYALKCGAEPEIVYILSFFISVGIQIVCVYIMSKLTGYSYLNYTKEVILPLTIVVFTSCVIPLVAHFMMQYGVIRFCVVLILSLIITSLTGYYIAMNDNEKEFLKQIVGKVFYKYCNKIG